MSSNEFMRAREMGIVSETARDFMPHAVSNGQVQVDFKGAARGLAMDAAMTTAVNAGVPAAISTYLDPRVVPVLFGKQGATQIFPEEKQGDWTNDYQNFPVEEITGSVSGYSDYGNAVSADVNYEYPVRALARFQTVIQYGDLESAKASSAKIALAARKQYAAAQVIARAENKFYFYGVADLQNYGLLNDPNLNPSISPISVDSKSTWADKQAANSATFANAAFNDVAKLFAELSAQNAGNIDQNTPMVLGISNKMAAYLVAPNSFGLTCQAMLKQNFPNLAIVQIPELSTTAGEELYLTVPELDGVPTATPAYADKYHLGRLVPEMSSFKQKAIGTSWGTVVRRPSLIARMVGI